MAPLLHLYTVIVVTLVAYGLDRYDRRRRSAALRRVASEFELNYTPTDQFRLTDRVADTFPVPGAAALTVTDLIYGIQGDRYRYIFTARYTIGAVRMKKRQRRVASYSEPLTSHSHGVTTTPAPKPVPSRVTVAPPELEWAEQYRSLASRPVTRDEVAPAVSGVQPV
jgi:hypothetical protein